MSHPMSHLQVFHSHVDGLLWMQSQSDLRRATHDLGWLKGAVDVKTEQNESQNNVSA